MQFINSKEIRLNILIIIYLSVCVQFTKEDLPVHCLKHQILGKWLITASDLIPVANGYEMKCGHDLPSKEETSYMANSPYELKNHFEVDLREIDYAELSLGSNTKNIGRWTMVYDEGFNMDFENYSFFSFSKYSIDKTNSAKTNYNSICYSTCVGWYHNKDKTKWGCYTAKKLNVNPSEITSKDSKNNINILEPTNDLENNILSSMLNMQFKSIGNSITFPADNKPDNNYDSNNISNVNENNLLNDKTKSQKNNLRRLYNKVKMNSFLELQTKEKGASLMTLSANFRNHALYVSKLNKIEKNWSADVNPEFSHMTIKELNKFAGISRSKNSKSSIKMSPKNSNKEDVSDLPKNFDWKNYLRPAGSQGNCGSCYAYSTIRMLESRLKIAYAHDVKLSVQHALDCTIYNQGCDGGYPFLVMKFASEFDLIPEMCKPYYEKTGKCHKNTCDVKLLPYLYRASNYHYIGGSYGQCSEKKMMKELMEKGPVVVSFEPDYNFMMYKSGIYHSIDEKTWISKGIPKPEWEKVDHSVLMVGWGEDEKTGEKFWIIQNTWGPQWGEDGFFRMRRGVDDFGIESICEAADPIIIEQATNKILEKKNSEKKIYNSIEKEYSVNNKDDLILKNNNENSPSDIMAMTNVILNGENDNNLKNSNLNTNALLNDSNSIGSDNNISGFNLNVQFNDFNSLGKNNNLNNNGENGHIKQDNLLDDKSIIDLY